MNAVDDDDEYDDDDDDEDEDKNKEKERLKSLHPVLYKINNIEYKDLFFSFNNTLTFVNL